jgi:hypothetical protein
MGPEWEAIAELVEQWEPGVAVVEEDGEVAVAVASDVDGVLTVEVGLVAAEVVEPVVCE